MSLFRSLCLWAMVLSLVAEAIAAGLGYTTIALTVFPLVTMVASSGVFIGVDRAGAAPPERTARFPKRDAPAGCCPICGQHDPDQLDQEGCHLSCAEWLGYTPRPVPAGSGKRAWDANADTSMPLDYAVRLSQAVISGALSLQTEHLVRPGKYTLHSNDSMDAVTVTAVHGRTVELAEPIRHAYCARDFLVPVSRWTEAIG